MTVEFIDVERYRIYVYCRNGEYRLAYNVSHTPGKETNRLYMELAIDKKTGEVTVTKQVNDPADLSATIGSSGKQDPFK